MTDQFRSARRSHKGGNNECSEDLGTPAAYLDALRGCDTVVHLAAVTGKAKPTDYFRVNREGTRALVDAAKAAGVRQLLHVSTIAVKYRDEQRYFYAHSKRDARLWATSS